jgi:hypothetical protein
MRHPGRLQSEQGSRLQLECAADVIGIRSSVVVPSRRAANVLVDQRRRFGGGWGVFAPILQDGGDRGIGRVRSTSARAEAASTRSAP